MNRFDNHLLETEYDKNWYTTNMNLPLSLLFPVAYPIYKQSDLINTLHLRSPTVLIQFPFYNTSILLLNETRNRAIRSTI